MTTPTILAATWRDGLFVLSGNTLRRELADQPVTSLAPDGNSGALVVVGGRSLCRRVAGGEWTTLATSESELSCCVAVGDAIYVGTDDAHVLRVGANGTFEQLAGFDAVAGRDKWYAGTALIDGRLVGPPLGVRSIAASCDDAVLLANVHVGGIPRSNDGGVTWQPTIDIDNDVHQVCAHPTRPEIVIAAAASGLCVSEDGGATWTTEQEGLHAPYCSAVAFAGDDILVAASADHFAAQGAIYRRPIDGDGSCCLSAEDCRGGSKASPIPVASRRTAQQSPWSTVRGTYTCRKTSAARGPAASTAFNPSSILIVEPIGGHFHGQQRYSCRARPTSKQ